MIEMECTNCGGALKRTDQNLYKCPYCDTEYVVNVGQNKKVHKVNAKNTQNGVAAQNTKTTKPAKTKEENVKKTDVTLAANKIQKKKSSIRPYAGKGKGVEGASVLIMVCMVFLIVFFIWAGMDERKEKVVGEEAKVPEVSAEEQEEFIAFAELLFGKEYILISEKEFESVTGISMTEGNGFLTIEATVKGEKKIVYMNASARAVRRGMHKLVNLSELFVNDDIKATEWKFFPSLTKLSCYNTIDNIAKNILYPEKITHLENVEWDKETEGLDRFPNLVSLSIRKTRIEDISGLAELKKLEHFSIHIYEGVKNFKVIGELENLKSLRIDSKELYTIDFVENLKYLEELEITSDGIQKIEPLRGRTNLKVLDIESVSDIEDIEIINTLTGLEKLSIDAGGLTNEIQWEKLPNLRSLKVQSGFSEIFMEELSKAEQLEDLYLSWNNSIKGVGELKNLKSLTLYFIWNIDCEELSGLNKLRNLNIIKTNYDAWNGEAIFNLPSIESVSISDTKLEVDMDAMKENRRLEELKISYSGINGTPVKHEAFKDEYDLKEAIIIVSNFPNLKYLTINGGLLENVDFAEKLVNLEVLNVEDNYIENLNGILNCDKLKLVRCGDNALTNYPNLGKDVFFDKEAEN